MKYLLLSYTPIADWDSSDPDTPSPEALEAFAIYEKFQAELIASGELVAAEGLGPPPCLGPCASRPTLSWSATDRSLS